METVENIDGVANASLTNPKWFLVHVGTKYITHGYHKGNVTSGEGDIELYDTKEELKEHADSVGVIIP